MPVLYDIDVPNGLIRTRCVGDVTLEEVLEHFKTLAQDPECPDHLDVLLDLSEETSLPRSDELREVAWAIRKIQGRVQFRACAVVTRTNALYGMLRVFQVFTEGLFGEFQVFRSAEEAGAWLAEVRAAYGRKSTAHTGSPGLPG
jgi:hypothetical protein